MKPPTLEETLRAANRAYHCGDHPLAAALMRQMERRFGKAPTPTPTPVSIGLLCAEEDAFSEAYARACTADTLPPPADLSSESAS